ncbi:MAG: hypothetical protein WAM14_00660 [Candidatus Nitrosopolaris sp.]
MSNEKSCEHFIGIEEENVTPKTHGCEECEKEGTDWVAIRMCLVCGHVGCCDSSCYKTFPKNRSYGDGCATKQAMEMVLCT